MTADGNITSLSLFYCYARKDQKLRAELDAHLTALRRSHNITTWCDGELVPGEAWEQAIEQRLNEADIILLLISPDFMNSEYCYGKEMRHAIYRHTAGTARVVPILLRPVDFMDAPFAALQMLPSNARPAISSSWPNQDEAFEDVARGLRRTISDLLEKRGVSTKQSFLQQASSNSYDQKVEILPLIILEDDDHSKEANNLGLMLLGDPAFDEADKNLETSIAAPEQAQKATNQPSFMTPVPAIEVENGPDILEVDLSFSSPLPLASNAPFAFLSEEEGDTDSARRFYAPRKHQTPLEVGYDWPYAYEVDHRGPASIHNPSRKRQLPVERASGPSNLSENESLFSSSPSWKPRKRIARSIPDNTYVHPQIPSLNSRSSGERLSDTSYATSPVVRIALRSVRNSLPRSPTKTSYSFNLSWARIPLILLFIGGCLWFLLANPPEISYHPIDQSATATVFLSKTATPHLALGSNHSSNSPTIIGGFNVPNLWWWVFAGLIACLLASVVLSSSYGCVVDFILGGLGALLGGFLVNLFSLDKPGDLYWTSLAALTGACVFLVLSHIFAKPSQMKRIPKRRY